MDRDDNELRRELENEIGAIENVARPMIGSLLLFSGTVLLFAAMVSRDALDQLPARAVEQSNWQFLLAVLVVIAGVSLLRQPRVARDPHWQPEQPGRRFDSVVLYTRSDCHLCHQALDVLLEHAPFLPLIEEIDIDAEDYQELAERYGTRVPVVTIDGRERFRGQINVLLLRRLIEATPPRDRRS